VAVVPSGNDEAGAAYTSVTDSRAAMAHSRELVLVGVAEFLEDGRRRLCSRWLVVGGSVHAEVVLHDICDGLCVRCRPRPATPYGVVDLCELVGDSVRDVCSGRCPTVGS
jgi:hypothetical protein